MTNDNMTAGPAYCAAAVPVRTKMPAPMMQPMPNSTRWIGAERAFQLAAIELGLDLGNRLGTPTHRAPLKL